MSTELKIPESLVDLAVRTSAARDGLFVLGSSAAVRFFERTFAEELRAAGCPLPPHETGMHSLHSFACDCLTDFDRGDHRHDVEDGLREWISAYPYPAVREYILTEANIKTMAQRLDRAIEKSSERYSDPLAVKYDQKNLFRAFLDSLKDGFDWGVPPQKNICRAMEEFSRAARKASRLVKDGDYKFSVEVERQLKEMGWPLRAANSEGNALYKELRGLFDVASSPVAVRKLLQDETTPPAPLQREVRDFILENANDLRHAVSIARDVFREKVAKKAYSP